MNKLTAKLCLSILCFLISSIAFNQGLYKVSLDKKVSQSSLIVEGKVISQRSFWNDAKKMIYTSNTIEVYKVFKGTADNPMIEVLTVGGQVGNQIIKASHQLSLRKNDIGIFLCFPNSVNLKSPITNSHLFDVYSSSQGFIKYDLQTQTAADALEEFTSIKNDLYIQLQGKIGRSYVTKKEFDLETKHTNGPEQIAAISGFSPASVWAGAILNTASILTINGSGFGAPGGLAAVEFNSADDASSTPTLAVEYNSGYMISWSDAQIILYVPGGAGTGVFEVINAAGVVTTSPSSLEVFFGVMSVELTADMVTYFPKEVRNANLNGLGGYTIVYNNNINSSPSKATFQRALTTWKEIAGHNITENPTSTATNTVANDGLNIIMLDNASTGNPPLGDGTLAVCYSYFGFCGNLSNQVFRSGFDIVIRQPGFSTGSGIFTNGPCPPNSTDASEVDLETVVLHELGHAINLEHIVDNYQAGMPAFLDEINPQKLMHFAIPGGAGLRRISPDQSAKAGADYAITPGGYTFGGCATEMIVLTKTLEVKNECPLTFPVSNTLRNTSVTFDLAHSTSNRLVDPAFNQIRCDGGGTDVTTNAYYVFRTNNVGGIVTLNISGYTTTPAAIASCTTPYGGVFITGVRLAIYQVNSCPTAQSFPAPVACRTFTGNGALANITGLTANTNYLMYLGGQENTKASFTVTFTGSALPINISEFTGDVLDTYNQLRWKIDFVKDVRSMFLERSSNGIEFEKIADVTKTLIPKIGEIEDHKPFVTNNYYRLAVENLDGSKEFSKTILLKRNDKLNVRVYPNPARQNLIIQINSQLAGKYLVKLRNNLGQEMISKTVQLSQIRQNISLNIEGWSSGVYHLTVYDEQNRVIKSEKIKVE